MGDMLEVQCRACGSISHTIAGALMAGPIVRCDTCGKTDVIPLHRFDEGPLPPSPCSCGGTLRSDAPIRCDACRSTEVDLEVQGIAD